MYTMETQFFKVKEMTDEPVRLAPEVPTQGSGGQVNAFRSWPQWHYLEAALLLSSFLYGDYSDFCGWQGLTSRGAAAISK